MTSIIPPAPTSRAYAGFWLRFWAFLIDWLILSPALLVAILLNILLGVGQVLVLPLLLAMHGFVLISAGGMIAVIHWLYFAGMESSALQATLGKRIMGLQVTDMAGSRIDFARASVRYWSKYLSALLWMAGFIMAGFTAQKQALHDFVAQTLVVRRLVLARKF